MDTSLFVSCRQLSVTIIWTHGVYIQYIFINEIRVRKRSMSMKVLRKKSGSSFFIVYFSIKPTLDIKYLNFLFLNKYIQNLVKISKMIFLAHSIAMSTRKIIQISIHENYLHTIVLLKNSKLHILIYSSKGG